MPGCHSTVQTWSSSQFWHTTLPRQTSSSLRGRDRQAAHGVAHSVLRFTASGMTAARTSLEPGHRTNNSECNKPWLALQLSTFQICIPPADVASPAGRRARTCVHAYGVRLRGSPRSALLVLETWRIDEYRIKHQATSHFPVLLQV